MARPTMNDAGKAADVLLAPAIENRWITEPTAARLRVAILSTLWSDCPSNMIRNIIEGAQALAEEEN